MPFWQALAESFDVLLGLVMGMAICVMGTPEKNGKILSLATPFLFTGFLIPVLRHHKSHPFSEPPVLHAAQQEACFVSICNTEQIEQIKMRRRN